MLCLRVPFECSDVGFVNLLSKLRRQQTSAINFGIKRFHKDVNLSSSACYKLIYNMRNIEALDSWLVVSACEESKLKSGIMREYSVFGGKKNRDDYIKGKISKDVYKSNKLRKLIVTGSAMYNGNRKFGLSNTTLIFKYKRGEHFNLQLKVGKNQRKILRNIEQAMLDCSAPISISLDDKHVCLTYDEVKTKNIELRPRNKVLDNRVLGIDLNPNHIGWNISDISKTREDQLTTIKTGNYDMSAFETKGRVNNHKKKHEVIHIAKDICVKARHYGCKFICLEDLSIKNRDSGKGRRFNKITKNTWLRTQTVNSLKKWARFYGIEIREIEAHYSSTIGNIVHDFPDMVASSLEISRRGFYKFQKGKSRYPKIVLENVEPELRKQIGSTEFKDWVSLHNWLKTTKLRYRRSLESYDFDVFRFGSKKSRVERLEDFL